MTTKLQTFTRKRNFLKGRITNCTNQARQIINDGHPSLCKEEVRVIAYTMRQLESTLNKWELGTELARKEHGID